LEANPNPFARRDWKGSEGERHKPPPTPPTGGEEERFEKGCKKNNSPGLNYTGATRIYILKMNDKKSQHIEVYHEPKFPSVWRG
jgi:hypothetical protein